MLIVGKPAIFDTHKFKDRVDKILKSSTFTNNGKFTQECESYINEYYGAKNSILVANGSLGLELLIKALIKFQFSGRRNLRCLVPSFTYVSTVSSLVRCGVKPVFGDVDASGCLSKTCLDRGNFDFILPVNVFGNLCAKEVYDTSYPQVWDNAHSNGIYVEHLNSYTGADVDYSMISYHSTKVGGAFEGAVLNVKSNEVADYLRTMRTMGYSLNSNVREGDVVEVSSNYKLSEVHAAAILTQMECLQEIQEHYFNIHQEYERLLPNLVLKKNNLFSNYGYVCLKVDSLSRDKIISVLATSGIHARTYFKPIHKMTAYKENINLPMTEKLSKELICVPTGLTVSPEDVQFIAKEVNYAVKESQ